MITWATVSKVLMGSAVIMASLCYAFSDTVGMLYAMVYVMAAGVAALYDEE